MSTQDTDEVTIINKIIFFKFNTLLPSSVKSLKNATHFSVSQQIILEGTCNGYGFKITYRIGYIGHAAQMCACGTLHDS
jgi:hypothetical protein